MKMYKGMMAASLLVGAGGAMASAIAAEMDRDADERRILITEPKPPRNYDIEGPELEPVPPEPLTRQQRRWQERQAKKHR